MVLTADGSVPMNLNREDCMRNLEPSQHSPEDRGKPRNPVFRWAVAKSSELCRYKRFTTYLIVNTLRYQCEDQLINAVSGNVYVYYGNKYAVSKMRMF
jgi:hypothetical protein